LLAQRLRMSGYIRFAGNGLSNVPRSNAPRVALLHLRLPAYLDGTGAPVAPRLASSLHPGFHCRWCLLAVAAGAWCASGAKEDVVATGVAACCSAPGEAILTMAATMPKVGSSPWAWIIFGVTAICARSLPAPGRATCHRRAVTAACWTSRPLGTAPVPTRRMSTS
jgi:hypothetical protein